MSLITETSILPFNLPQNMHYSLKRWMSQTVVILFMLGNLETLTLIKRKKDIQYLALASI